MKTLSAVAAVVAAVISSACSDAVSPVKVFDGLASTPTPASDGGVASSAPANLALPFRGRFAGTQRVTPLTGTPPRASVEVSAEGIATHLGRFTIALPHIVNFATQSANGTATIVAANGDQISATFVGTAQLGPVVTIVEQATVTGGTGRFSGATGSFRIERVFDPAAGTTIGSFEGTISAPHAGG
jgi:hypothetical protein